VFCRAFLSTCTCHSVSHHSSASIASLDSVICCTFARRVWVCLPSPVVCVVACPSFPVLVHPSPRSPRLCSAVWCFFRLRVSAPFSLPSILVPLWWPACRPSFAAVVVSSCVFLAACLRLGLLPVGPSLGPCAIRVVVSPPHAAARLLVTPGVSPPVFSVAFCSLQLDAYLFYFPLSLASCNRLCIMSGPNFSSLFFSILITTSSRVLFCATLSVLCLLFFLLFVFLPILSFLLIVSLVSYFCIVTPLSFALFPPSALSWFFVLVLAYFYYPVVPSARGLRRCPVH